MYIFSDCQQLRNNSVPFYDALTETIFEKTMKVFKANTIYSEAF